MQVTTRNLAAGHVGALVSIHSERLNSAELGFDIQLADKVFSRAGKKLAYLEIRIFMCIIFWNFKLLPVPAELASYGAVDIVAHQPRQCFIRLAEAEGK